MSPEVWADSPEERITREEYRASKAGLTAGQYGEDGEPRGVGRFLERIVIRELQKIAHEQYDSELRFEHGVVVEDYGSRKYPGASASGASGVDTDASPEFDIVCYRGDVAWTYSDGKPLAVVPESFLYGVVEVKRGVNGSNLDAINRQLRRQSEYLDSARGVRVPQILVGVQYFGGQVVEMVTEAVSEYVALIGDINGSGSARSMTEPVEVGEKGFVGRGCLESVVSVLNEQAE
ncbi:hypothetical protein [Halosolutus halophilus]|uniref:hypothetical protein n=1 Tax=Halosolutus halophilus TaxID=1552990 RepID=UPI0022352D1D|nr:hypothetical protein [Halosolutus halophilus]